MNSIFKPRPIRFLELLDFNGWKVKTYSISFDSSDITEVITSTVKSNLCEWLLKSKDYNIPTYNIATLIIHKWRGGHFAIISWWTDENMLQVLVYLATNENPTHFKLYSDKGIVTCVWEMEVLWFERNAWIEEVLRKEINSENINNYLQKTLNKY